ncbi:MAG: LCP family protein [Clostridia bacterium]|nr:LCP family protein [Clostridia bacterium]
MKDNEKYFNFEFEDDFEDISSKSEKEEMKFEDIVSDTSLENGEFITLDDMTSGDFMKKKRGLAKFFKKIKKWWKKLKKGQKAAVISVTAAVLVVALIFTVPHLIYNYRYLTGNYEDLGITDIIDEEVVNVALFGIDARNTKSFKGLSDSIMILSINTETKKVKIISVMRDSLVPINYKGKTTYGKITTAYSKGGPELAIKTLNQNFNLDIKEYATVNFYGMADIIDAVGGIDVTLTEREVTARGNVHGINDMIQELCLYLGYNPEKYYVKKWGNQHLNGVQAVAYARIRHVANTWGTTNDYGRTDRQRYVMEQLFNKATQMKKSQYTKMIKALIPCTETSLSMSEIFSLAVDVLLKEPSFEQTRVPQPEFAMPSPSGNFGSVVYYDLDYAGEVIHGVIYDDMTIEEYVAANKIEKNDWYRKVAGNYTVAGSSGTVSTAPNTDNTVSEDTPINITPDDETSSTDSTVSEDVSSKTDSDKDTSSEDGETTSDNTESGDGENSDNTDNTVNEERSGGENNE